MAFSMRLALILQISFVFVIASKDPCHNDGKYECPKYTVTEKGNGYELRKYKKTHWAVAQSGSSGYRSTSSLFRRLFKYIQGANKDNVTIPMTVPVLMPKQFDQDGDFKTGQSMMFWLPEKFQKNPPVPKYDNVKIVLEPETDVYVRSFGWWAFNWLVKKNTAQLMADLKDAGLADFDASMVIVASYNSPWQLFGRTNEVMLIKKAKIM